MDFDCEVLSRRGSDHCPIIIKLNEELFETEKIPQWNFKRANWKSFKEQCKREINEELFEGQEDKMQVFTEKLIDIAGDNIPKTSPFYKKCSKPWFDKECTAARRERTRANRLLRRNPCQENHIEAKKANAKATRTFKRKKRESWRNYVSSINSRTPTKKVWNMVRKITGKNTKSHMLHLKDQKGNLITNKDDIANEIGSTFEKSSSSDNYSDKFKNIKMKEERKHLDFHAGENYKYKKYNKRFKLRDLKRSIKRSKDSTPGPDGVHYTILKNLFTRKGHCLHINMYADNAGCRPHQPGASPWLIGNASPGTLQLCLQCSRRGCCKFAVADIPADALRGFGVVLTLFLRNYVEVALELRRGYAVCLLGLHWPTAISQACRFESD